METLYEKSCKELNFTPLTIEDFIKHPEEDRVSSFAYHKLTMVHRAKNRDKVTGKNWLVNWLDRSQWKWWNWLRAIEDKKRPSGLGFSFLVSAFDFSYTAVGSRLCSKDEKTAKEIGTDPEAIEYYREFFE